jgi:ribosomal protein L11 methyltransferase
MYLWRRFATEKWSNKNEEKLRAMAGDGLAIVQRPDRKRLQLEAASNHRADLRNIAKQFGGRIEKLPRDWLKRSLRHKAKPIRIRDRMLTIPAGAAFGTGEHATTAMSLRLLETLTREWNRGWSMADLGTGSGILSLAAKILGASRAIGIDNDPIAISTAKQNARLNNVRNVEFRVADVRHWKPPDRFDIVTANLFSELLIQVLPKLRDAHWLVLSGVLRSQERDLRRNLTRNEIDLIEVRRRGKWVAILARSR